MTSRQSILLLAGLVLAGSSAAAQQAPQQPQPPPAQQQGPPVQQQAPQQPQGPPPPYYPPAPYYDPSQPPPPYYGPQGQQPYYQGQPQQPYYQGQPQQPYYQGQPQQPYYYNQPTLPQQRVHPASVTRGYLGFSGLFTGVLGQSNGLEYLANGGGVSIWGGVRFNRLFALELEYTGSFHNPELACVPGYFGSYCFGNYLVLDLLGIAGKFHFPTGTDFDPYVQVGAMLGWLGREGYRGDGSGGGFEAGGGFDYWLNPWITLGLRTLYRGVQMGDPARLNADSFLSLLTIELAVGIHF